MIESHHPTSLHMIFDYIINQIYIQRVKIYTKTVLLVLKAIRIRIVPQNVLSNNIIQISILISQDDYFAKDSIHMHA